MWKWVWIAVLVTGMASFVLTALVVAVKALPELIDLLRLHRRGGDEGPRVPGAEAT